jgi:hypothetical protein
MTATDTHATIEELLEAVFSVRSVPRLYNEEQLTIYCTLYIVKDRPDLSSERAPQINKTAIV